MGNYRNKGSIGPTTQKVAQSYDSKTGYTTTYIHEGTASALADLKSNYEQQGCKVSYESIGEANDYYRLTVTFSAAEPSAVSPEEATTELSDEWTLEGNMLEKSIWTHPTLTAQLDLVIDRKIRTGLIKTLKRFADGDADTLDEYDTVAAILDDVNAIQFNVGYSALTTTVFESLMDELLKGVDAYEVSQWVLKRTIELPPACVTVINDAYTGRIFSTAGLAAFEALPASGLRFSLSSIAPTGYWLKRCPTANFKRNGNTTISYEYWHADSWSYFIYGALVA